MNNPDLESDDAASPSGWRLARYLARCGVASRRGAEDLIRAGRIRVNGLVATDLGRRVQPGIDVVSADGAAVAPSLEHVTLVHHKPPGVLVSRRDPHHTGQTVYDLLPADLAPLGSRLVYAGRLDRDSEGLLILSTDGDLVNSMMHPRHHVEKEYMVTLDGVISAAEAGVLSKGVELEDGLTMPCRVERLRNSRLRIVLTEGRNRQIRRMVATLGRRVVRLVRDRVGGVILGDLEAGKFRFASPAEIDSLQSSLHETGPQGADVD